MFGVPDTLEVELAGRLSKAGLVAAVRSPMSPVDGLVVRWEIVRVSPGSQLNRWDYPGLAGAAFVEVEGQIGDESDTYAHFYARGTRRYGFFGGGSQALVTSAAKLAARSSAKQIVAALKSL
jgi:hypothetical protein